MTRFSTRVTTDSRKGTYAVTFFIKHEGGDGPSLVGAVPGLTANLNGGTASPVLILSPRDGTSGHRHVEIRSDGMEVEITEVVDEGNVLPMVFLISLPG